MSQPPSPIQAAVTRARIERVIARLPGLSEERVEGIECLAEVKFGCSIPHGHR